MAEVGIPAPDARYRAYPHEFSGGMQQRALIAIALACEPKLILADEPTTALDVTIQAQILDLVGEINRSHGTSIILVTHDLGVAAEFCQRVAVMYAGRIVELGTVDQVIEQAQHPYTIGLLDCIPHVGTERRPLNPIPGSVPDLATLPQGCSFAPRCQLARASCETGPIPLIDLGDGHYSRCLRHVGFDRQQDWVWRTELTGEPVHG
jgi:oligopeptide/dipeptide ABC transporter ATP-binding protein